MNGSICKNCIAYIFRTHWNNQEFLNAQPAVHETKYLRHVHFHQPMVVKMDGKKKLGVVLMPEE